MKEAGVSEEIITGFGEAMLVDEESENGQVWFEEFRRNAESLGEQYTEEEVREHYPGSWALLKMLNE